MGAKKYLKPKVERKNLRIGGFGGHPLDYWFIQNYFNDRQIIWHGKPA